MTSQRPLSYSESEAITQGTKSTIFHFWPKQNTARTGKLSSANMASTKLLTSLCKGARAQQTFGEYER